MIKINLLAEKKPTRSAVPTMSIGVGGGAQNGLLAVVLVLAVAFIAWQWFSLSSRKANLRDEIRKADTELARLAEVRAKGAEYERQRAELERKVNLITQLKRNQAVPVHILDQLSKNLPDFLWLDSMNEAGNVLTIRGKATNYNAVANFYNNLSSSPWFSTVTQGAITEAPAGVTFSMTTRFTPQREAEQIAQG